MSDGEYFPPMTRTSVAVRHVETALRTARRLASTRITILGYQGEPDTGAPWFCFDVGERKFAIWTATGKLYEVDASGAVGDDPVSL